jgi:hypothetical protein
MFLVSAQQETRYFEETGHNVSGPFLRFYEAYGGRRIFGYPLTSEFDENGRRVQYFQRARMERYADGPESHQVWIGALGKELGYAQPPLSESELPSPDHPDKRYFGESGHTVAFAFLDFYESHAGPELLGYPITEWVIELNGRIVQYFEKGKLEWYPGNPSGQRVQLGMLGTIYVEQFVDPIHTQRERYIRTGVSALTGTRVTDSSAIDSNATDTQVTDTSVADSSVTDAGGTDTSASPSRAVPLEVTGLEVVATLDRPIIGLQGTQTAHIYVRDQINQGVEGVPVEVEVQYRDGRVDRLTSPVTNEHGYSQISFAIGDPAPGVVVIVTLRARYESLEASTNAAFLPWW